MKQLQQFSVVEDDLFSCLEEKLVKIHKGKKYVISILSIFPLKKTEMVLGHLRIQTSDTFPWLCYADMILL